MNKLKQRSIMNLVRAYIEAQKQYREQSTLAIILLTQRAIVGSGKEGDAILKDLEEVRDRMQALEDMLGPAEEALDIWTREEGTYGDN